MNNLLEAVRLLKEVVESHNKALLDIIEKHNVLAQQFEEHLYDLHARDRS